MIESDQLPMFLWTPTISVIGRLAKEHRNCSTLGLNWQLTVRNDCNQRRSLPTEKGHHCTTLTLQQHIRGPKISHWTLHLLSQKVYIDNRWLDIDTRDFYIRKVDHAICNLQQTRAVLLASKGRSCHPFLSRPFSKWMRKDRLLDSCYGVPKPKGRPLKCALKVSS